MASQIILLGVLLRREGPDFITKDGKCPCLRTFRNSGTAALLSNMHQVSVMNIHQTLLVTFFCFKSSVKAAEWNGPRDTQTPAWLGDARAFLWLSGAGGVGAWTLPGTLTRSWLRSSLQTASVPGFLFSACAREAGSGRSSRDELPRGLQQPGGGVWHVVGL